MYSDLGFCACRIPYCLCYLELTVSICALEINFQKINGYAFIALFNFFD